MIQFVLNLKSRLIVVLSDLSGCLRQSARLEMSTEDPTEISPASSSSVSPPSANELVTNIVAEANESITTYLDQSGSKPSAGAKKRAPRRSDATKIESVFVRVDVFAEVHSLLLSTMSYFCCMAEEGKNKRIVQPAIASLTYAAAQIKEHLGGLSSDLNHTASLKQAQQSHSKKTKRARRVALQMRDASTMAEENARLSSVDDERWRDQILEDNTAYEGELHKLHGRTSGDRCRDDFLDDETRSQRVLKHVAQKRGQCKPFVQARKMQRKGDSSFKEPKCVGKLKGLQSALQKLDNGGSEDQLTKQENSWILQTILCYKLPLKLVVDEGPNEGSAGDGGDDERGTDEGGADEEGVVDPPPARPRTLVVDASTFLELRRNEFLNNAETVGDLSHAIKGCRIETRIHATLKVHAEALTRLLPEQLARMATTLPDQVRYSWVMAACRDNIDSMAQIISLAGQSMMNVETSTYGECILRPPSIGYYSKPLQSDDLKSFQGVALYYDHQKAKFRFPAIVHGSGKSFEQRWKEDQRNAKSKTPSTSFTKQYPSSKPRDAEKGGWDGVFGRDLTMYVGIGIDPNGNNECLLRKENGPFVWSERTMKKLEESSATGTIADKQLRLICVMFELTYFLMMGKDDAIDIGTPFRHFIGPSK